MSRLKELIEKRATLWESNKKILDDAEGENRDLKAEERQQWELQNDAIDEASGEIDLRKKQAHLDEFMDSVEAPLTQAAKPLGQNRGLADDATLSFDLGPPKNPAYDGSNGRMERVSEHPENWDRKLTIRPDSRQAASATREYAAALERYLLSGEIQTALRTDDDTKGGFLTTIQTETQMLKLLDDKVFMRQIGTVKPPLTSATGMGVITIDSDPNDAEWTAELPAVDIPEDTNMSFGKRELFPHLLSKRMNLTMKAMRASSGSLVQIVIDRLGRVHSIAEEKGFLVGSGSDQPLGVFTASDDGISTARDVVANTVVASKWDGDDLIDLIGTLKPGYEERATILLHRDAITHTRKLKSTDDQYLWRPGLADDRPNTILGLPYIRNEFAPNTYTANQYAMVVGDFSFYWIVDALGFTVQRLDELLALRNQVLFVGRKETDGMPMLEEAFVRLKLAAS